MKLCKKAVKMIDKAYEPGMTAEELAEAAGVPMFKSHRYLAEKLFEERILALREQGLSYRQIARELDMPHPTVHRVVVPLEST
jgi:DNA-binding IclR family transcriptional regulator